MIGYQTIQTLHNQIQFIVSSWILICALAYVLIGEFLKNIGVFFKDLSNFDFDPYAHTNDNNYNTRFNDWGVKSMQPIRTYYTDQQGKARVKLLEEDRPYHKGAPSADYSWKWIAEENAMGWTNDEPVPIVTIIMSDGFGTICDNICKDK